MPSSSVVLLVSWSASAAIVAAGALGVAGCSGAAATALFDAPSGFTTGGMLDGSAGSSGSADGAAPPGPSSPHDSGAVDSGSAAQPQDSAAPTSDDSGSVPVVDSAPPADPGISCGAATCDPKNKVCCINEDQNGDQTLACASAGECSSNGGLALPCQRAADCRLAGFPSGTVCCVSTAQGSSTASSVACVPAAECDQPSQSWLCDPGVAGACPMGDACIQSTVTIPPYSICVKSP